jgi:hypothetical protein
MFNSQILYAVPPGVPFLIVGRETSVEENTVFSPFSPARRIPILLIERRLHCSISLLSCNAAE